MTKDSAKRKTAFLLDFLGCRMEHDVMNRKNWKVASAVAAMLAVTVSAASAQDMMKDKSMMKDKMMSGDKMMMSGTPDFSLLSHSPYSYVELQQAMRLGYSETQIATIAKIARLSGWSFSDVYGKVKRGETFGMIANAANLKLSDVLNVDDEKQTVSDYKTAFESTGMMSMKNMGMMPGGMMNGDKMMTPMKPMKPAMSASSDIVDTAIAAGNFKTLVRLVQAAGLVDTLKGPGPFTVFAPTDAAFAKLPAGTLDDLAKPENADKLKAILTYHVLPAKVDAKTAMSMTSPTSPPTVEGDTLQVTTRNGKVMINDATVVMADVMTTNGIIHAIDTVLMPPAK